MSSKHAINSRVLKEIADLKVEEPLKTFLQEILEMELQNIDKDKGPYMQDYLAAVDRLHRSLGASI